MEKKEILKTTMNQLPPFEAKIKRLLIIENLKMGTRMRRRGRIITDLLIAICVFKGKLTIKNNQRKSVSSASSAFLFRLPAGRLLSPD